MVVSEFGDLSREICVAEIRTLGNDGGMLSLAVNRWGI